MYIIGTNSETEHNLYALDKNRESYFNWLQCFKTKGVLFSSGKRKYKKENQYTIPSSNETA